jgi:adenosine deaminase
LLFGARLAEQYRIARDWHGCTDPDLAALARDSVEASLAPEDVKDRLRAGIVAWLD